MGDLQINGEVRRSFVFPADIATAFAFYSDAERIYRMLYQSVELGIYRVQIYCDLEPVLDGQNYSLCFVSFQGEQPVSPQASLQSVTTQGAFSSESVFRDEGAQTRIDYRLHLQAALPVPPSARMFIPAAVLDLIAQSIMYRRIDEIADGFILKSIQSYLAESERSVRAG